MHETMKMIFILAYLLTISTIAAITNPEVNITSGTIALNSFSVGCPRAPIRFFALFASLICLCEYPFLFSATVSTNAKCSTQET